MAKILEYQGKQLLEKAGIRVPTGGIASTPREAKGIAEKIGNPVVVKAQVLASGRLQAGGIRFANTPEEAAAVTEAMIGKNIKDLYVELVLIEEMIDVIHEYYAGVIIDSSVDVKAPVLVFSNKGGNGIEQIAVHGPEQFFKHTVDPLVGLEAQAVYSILEKTGITAQAQQKICDMLCRLYQFFKQTDASNAEIDPLVMSKTGHLYAADCRVTIDDNAVFRHPEFEIKIPIDMLRQATELEKLVWDQIKKSDCRGNGYFAQITTTFEPGEIFVGFHGIGGGGAMLGAAALISRGIKLANYADTSGDPHATKIYKIIKSIFSQPISAYIVIGACLANQEQWYHAFAIVKALREELKNRPGFPVVILLAGNKEAEAMRIIRDGLEDLNLRIELYGRDFIYNSDYIGERLEVLMTEYLKEISNKHGQKQRICNQ